MMPFGRGDPVPCIPPPLHQTVHGVGGVGGGVSIGDGHPNWHPDQTLSVSWPFPFTLSAFDHAGRECNERAGGAAEGVAQLEKENK